MAKIKVLVVDDEPDFLSLAKMRLEFEGYGVITASSGKEAIDLIKNNRPDIAFLDIKMPEMDGVETLRSIRKFDKKLPVVMITAYGTMENWRDTVGLGISSYIPKGVPGKDTIKTMLNNLKTNKDLRK